MANTASPALAVSTTKVSPQHRGFDSDRAREVIVSFPAKPDPQHVLFHFDGIQDGEHYWSPRDAVEITNVDLINGAVAMATATNTTAIDVDIEDGADTKAHDVCAKAAATALAAGTMSALTLTGSEGDATRQLASGEVLLVADDITGTQGAHSVSVTYVPINRVYQRNIQLPNKARITGVRLVNHDVAMLTATTTVAINVDIEDGAGTKTHDVCAKAAATAVAADADAALTLSTTEADLIVENTEIIRVDYTGVGITGGCDVVISYVDLEVPDTAVAAAGWGPS